MQTVNFQCGHCGNLMGVSVEFLGQQVRCPHCQQVVVAPSTASESEQDRTLGETMMTMGPKGDDADYGVSNTAPADGSGLNSPQMQLDPTSVVQSNAHEELTLGASLSPPGIGPTQPFAPASDSAAPNTFLPDTVPVSPAPAESSLPWMDAPTTATSSGDPAPSVRRARKESMWWVWLVLPLVSYSIFATIIIVWLWNRSTSTPPKQNQLELMPDLNGDNPLEKRLNKAFEYPSTLATSDVPDKHRIKLGDAFKVGALEVTPVSVQTKVVRIKVENYEKAEDCLFKSLVLNLKVTNLSDKFAFAPLDNYFDRQYTEKGKGAPPLTALEMGSDRRFFGGPAPWCPLKRSKKERVDRQWVEGRKMVDPEVKPGESLETFVCTDGNDEKLSDLLNKYEGPLLWRVHLRCGPTSYKDKLVAATTVIGVEFTDKDYRK